MTNPESQNTGILTTAPVRLMVSGARFFPTMFKIVLAIVSAAPVFSRMVPMIVPAMMTIPILPRIPPKPAVIVVTRESTGSPPSRPTKYAESSSTMNGCHLNLDINTIIPTIAIKITRNRYHPVIYHPPRCSHYIYSITLYGVKFPYSS